MVMCLEDKLVMQKLALICKSAVFDGVDEIVVERIVTDNRCILQQMPKGDRRCSWKSRCRTGKI